MPELELIHVYGQTVTRLHEFVRGPMLVSVSRNPSYHPQGRCQKFREKLLLEKNWPVQSWNWTVLRRPSVRKVWK